MKERLQQLRARWSWLDLVLDVVEKGGRDGAGLLAALIAFFSFFSLFPLLMVFVWVLGEVMTPKLQKTLVDSALSKFPVIGNSIKVGSLQGGVVPLLVGLLGALWAGTKAFEAFERAMHIVWTGHEEKPEPFFKRKLRAVVLIGAFGVGLVLTTAGSALVTVASWIPGAARPFAFLVSALMNGLLVGVMYGLSTPNHPSWRRLWPGAAVAGIALAFLYTVGTTYLTRVIKGAGDTYGTFAVVIGLLTWLNLIGTVIVWSAELNSVLNARWTAGQRLRRR